LELVSGWVWRICSYDQLAPLDGSRAASSARRSCDSQDLHTVHDALASAYRCGYTTYLYVSRRETQESASKRTKTMGWVRLPQCLRQTPQVWREKEPQTMSTTVQKLALLRARSLIADAPRWTSGGLARAPDGRVVAWIDDSATQWCAVGAIYRATYDLVRDQKKAICIGDQIAARILPRPWPRGSLVALNDACGHAAVLAAFDRALDLV
jgi:hypothetical protein